MKATLPNPEAVPPDGLVPMYQHAADLVKTMEVCREFRSDAVPERLMFSQLKLRMDAQVIGRRVDVAEVPDIWEDYVSECPPIKKFNVKEDFGFLPSTQGEDKIIDGVMYTQPQIGARYKSSVRGKVVSTDLEQGLLIVRPRFLFPDDRFWINVLAPDGKTPLVDIGFLDKPKKH